MQKILVGSQKQKILVWFHKAKIRLFPQSKKNRSVHNKTRNSNNRESKGNVLVTKM
jgi:hypothetical protein